MSIAAHLQAASLPAAVSQTAGTFVCNHVFYGLMHLLRRRRGVRGGFLHLPLLPEQEASAAVPGLQGLALASQVAGVRLALQSITGAACNADPVFQCLTDFKLQARAGAPRGVGIKPGRYECALIGGRTAASRARSR